ncbi:hypothetical protein C8R46DRAFT_903677 [Mycena filopes]|nr:hypothetical protein C8R46DRAFT_903677 [Mycena filopes]
MFRLRLFAIGRHQSRRQRVRFPSISWVANDGLMLNIFSYDESSTNAESYAQAAMAIYLQKTFHLKTPPLPMGYKGAAAGNVTGSRLHELVLSAPPTGWNSPVPNTNATYNPDLTDVVLLSTIGAMTTGPTDCTQSTLNTTVICSGCPPPACNPGSYPDFDTCFDLCQNGICTENAGEEGIQCTQCPS